MTQNSNPKTYRPKDKSKLEKTKNSKNKEKLAKLQKLKELQKLEKIFKVQQQKTSVKIIEKFMKGYSDRKKLSSIRNYVNIIKTLRNLLERSLLKQRKTTISKLTFCLTKAAQSKLKKLKGNFQEKRKSPIYPLGHDKSYQKQRTKNLVSLNEARNQQYDRSFRTPTKPQNSLYSLPPAVTSKIIAFVRGWKIRKIIK